MSFSMKEHECKELVKSDPDNTRSIEYINHTSLNREGWALLIDSSIEFVYINYCPFCGVKLEKLEEGRDEATL
jgi:hypothetical protein